MHREKRKAGGITTLALLSALLLPGVAMAAKAPTTQPVVKKAVAFPKPQRVEVSIPYPNAGMYLYRGIYGSFAGGRYQATDSTGTRDPLFQWQGEIVYFYTDWFSSGMSYKIIAGEPSDSAQEVKNRYTLVARFHNAWPTAAVYAGVNLGVDDVNISLTPSTDTVNALTQPLKETNAGLGLEVGGGWKFSKYVGATLGQRVDISLVRQNETDRNRALTFRTSPGVALDILKLAPSLREQVKGLYGLFEMQYGQQLLQNGNWRRDFAWITGVSLAF
jgi:hypothetical protein